MDARPSPSLSLLLAASAALTGPAARADDVAATHGVGYRFQVYDEDALGGTTFGDPRRYHVDSQQFALATRIGQRDSLNVNATHEVMSGSSPWFVLPDANGKPIQVLSGATIHDRRDALSATLTHDSGGNDTRSVSASYSHERDYRAAALGATRTLPLNAAWTLGFGGSFSHDAIRPFQAEQYGRIAHAQKNSASLFASLSRVLNRSAVVESGIQVNVQTGHLSDPYKLATVGSTQFPDSRPSQRSEAAWLVRYRLAATSQAALHLNSRVSANSWGQHALTLEARWYQTLHDGWQLVPDVRYYAQTRARFYAPYFAADAGPYVSSDYRLGAFGALSGGVNLRKRFAHWEFSVGAERYHASTRFAPGAAGLNPAAVSYTRMFAGLDYRFD